jgi:hypothetical protein
MAPIGAFVRRNGEHVVVHRCLTCRHERYNRIAADDYFELVLSLPSMQERYGVRVVEVETEQEERTA